MLCSPMTRSGEAWDCDIYWETKQRLLKTKYNID